MHDRSTLGAADLSDAELTALVARRLGCGDAGEVELLDSCAEVAAYDLEALTTAGRYWVRGRARTAYGERAFSFFVKVVQSWARSPLFASVPAEHRELALARLPWKTEPLIYRSDLSARLPEGLAMPTAFAVVDIDGESAALWLEEVDLIGAAWDADRFSRAAYLLGRLAASERVRPLARIGTGDAQRGARAYAEGRVTHQLLPALHSDELWLHPLVADAFDDRLRAELIAAVDDVGSIVEEIETMPIGTFHGDACTRNLLAQPSAEALVLIDYAFWGEGPLGFDLGQLLLGEVQLGERPASCLPDLEALCFPAYVDGLRSEGCAAGADVVRRAHALLMLLFSGLSSLPFEHMGKPATPELHRIARQRAQSARFMLALVHATN